MLLRENVLRPCSPGRPAAMQKKVCNGEDAVASTRRLRRDYREPRKRGCSPEMSFLRMTMPPALSFHAIESFLKQLQIRRVTRLFSGRLDPFLLQGVFGRAIGFVKHAENSRERDRGELVGRELVGDVVPEL